MSKEKIQEYKSKQLIDELSKMPPMVIATAYLHALNYTLYGEDVFYDNDYFSGNKEAMLKRNEVLRIIYKYKALDQERDCEHCVHHTDKGCSSWDCEFERRTE